VSVRFVRVSVLGESEGGGGERISRRRRKSSSDCSSIGEFCSRSQVMVKCNHTTLQRPILPVDTRQSIVLVYLSYLSRSRDLADRK
jgi:hypothetical protein